MSGRVERGKHLKDKKTHPMELEFELFGVAVNHIFLENFVPILKSGDNFDRFTSAVNI